MTNIEPSLASSHGICGKQQPDGGTNLRQRRRAAGVRARNFELKRSAVNVPTLRLCDSATYRPQDRLHCHNYFHTPRCPAIWVRSFHFRAARADSPRSFDRLWDESCGVSTDLSPKVDKGRK